MSTQSYTPNHQATNQQGNGSSWFRIWIVTVGTAVAVVFIALAVSLWHGHSGTAPASNGTSTSVPARPTTPVMPTAPVTPTHAADGASN
jgi:hypothetical protein